MKLIPSLLAGVALLSSSCSLDSIVSINRSESKAPVDSVSLELPQFSKLQTSGGLPVYYTTSSSEASVKIIAPADLLPYIDVTVNGITLKCSLKNNCPFHISPKKVKILVSGPALDCINSSSSSRIYFTNLMEIRHSIEINASSSATIEASVKSPFVDLSASSSGYITIAAECETADLSASSSGSLLASIHASNHIESTASSSGSIEIEGLTAKVELDATSSGHINASKLKAETGSAYASSSGNISCNILSPTSITTKSAGHIKNL